MWHRIAFIAIVGWSLPLPAQDFPVTPGVADPAAAAILRDRAALLARLSPVTDDQLRRPPPESWLTWRRTYDGWGYSPLDQIKQRNVGALTLAWSWALSTGPSPTTPLVHEGVLFVYNYGDRIQALVAATGDLLWEYARQLPDGVRLQYKRSIAIAGDRLFFASSDIHLVALDIRTGKVVWDHEVADWHDDWWYTAGPMVVRDKVIMGMSGCGNGQRGGCFISAHDIASGAEIWRFNTIARLGLPGGDSWNGLAHDERYGGSVWAAGSYDPELNLLYYGIGQPYPWNATLRGTSPRSMGGGGGNEALYTNSTVALNPDSGALVWHYQHLPNDSWDMDYAFDRVLVELQVEGARRKLVITAGKLGIVEALDARTGAFVFAIDPGVQNLVTSIDPGTGAKILDLARDPVPGETASLCPHPGGARSFPAAGYNPRRQTLHLPMQWHCAEYEPIPLDPGESYQGGGGARWRITPHPDAAGTIGRLQTFDLATQSLGWQHRDRAPQSTASLPTGGGLIFQGTQDRYFRAHDDTTGAVLWQTRLGDVPNSFPISYAVAGRQYVAVTTGAGTPYTRTWASLTPDIRLPSQAGAMLWVFALPE
ncbi:MAG: PQQ-binding-like beta-propeller repeat protein [Gammaproteobacteria bacterium]|nr:PQQ-binding-like beta-propeller repeat protein [Gammaproteobacteria bacterium]